MFIEQKIRSVLFYLSVVIFLIGIPFILSSALGYKFDRHTFKFTKSGLIVLKTQPAGAGIYLDNKLLSEKTPATINELLPGRYHLSIELDRHYPWVGDVNVEAGKITRLDKIILFPRRPNIKQVNKERLSSFWIDEKRGVLYYLNQEDNSVYKSDLEGEHFQKIASLPEISPAPLKWKISDDRDRLLSFNVHKIVIANLGSPKESSPIEPPFVLDFLGARIIDAFWHSDSYHIIVISDRRIDVLEAKPQAMPVTLVNLNKKNTSAFYDIQTDTLYFLDSERAPDGNIYDNLYKLELNVKTSALQDLIKIKPNE